MWWSVSGCLVDDVWLCSLCTSSVVIGSVVVVYSVLIYLLVVWVGCGVCLGMLIGYGMWWLSRWLWDGCLLVYVDLGL